MLFVKADLCLIICQLS